MDNEEKGILVDQVIQAERIRNSTKSHEYIFLAVRFLYLFLGSCGVSLGLTLTYQIKINYILLLLGVLVISALITALWQVPVRQLFLWLGILAGYILTGVLLQGILRAGFGTLYNHFVQLVNEYYDAKWPLIAMEAATGLQMLLTTLYLTGIFSFVLSLGTIRSLDARVTAFVFAVPFMLALAVSRLPVKSAVILMLLVLIGILALQYTRYRESFSVRTVTVRMENSLFGRLRWQTAAIATALMMLILPVCNAMLGPVLTEGFEAQSEIREDIRNGDLQRSFRNLWKKIKRGEWDWLPFDIIRSSGVHGGKLSNIKEVRDYGEIHLYISISSELKSPLYIRGYVGSNYTGKGWKELNDEQNASGILSNTDLIGLNSRFYEILGNEYHNKNTDVARRDLVLSVAEANSSFSYIPYGSNLDQFTAGDPFDAYTEEDLDRQILSMYYMNTQRVSNLNELEQLGKTQSWDEAYRGFVRNTYLTVPTEDMPQFLAEYSGKQFASIGDCVAFVRSTLDEHASYTKAPGSTPRGKDYVEYFLFENHQGVCTHFASAAVLLFRLYGIPARYVEGYLVKELDGEKGVQKIMDDQAHAWPEIYINGIGWVPVEVTPGFISEEDLRDEKEEPESSLSQDHLDDVTDPAEETTQAETTMEQTEMPIEPTKPQQPTSPSAQQPTQPQEPDTHSSGIWKLILKLIVGILLVILLLAAAAYGVIYQRTARLKHQEKQLSGEPKEALLFAIRRMNELFAAQKLPTLDQAVSAEDYQEWFPTMTQSRLEWFQDLQQELTFSNHKYGSELRDETSGFYRELASDVIAKQKWMMKLWYRYVKCFG